MFIKHHIEYPTNLRVIEPQVFDPPHKNYKRTKFFYERKSTGTIEMAITDLDCVDDEVPHFSVFDTPNTKTHYGHLEPTVECDGHSL